VDEVCGSSFREAIRGPEAHHLFQRGGFCVEQSFFPQLKAKKVLTHSIHDICTIRLNMFFKIRDF
jgi:hypothetical protein